MRFLAVSGITAIGYRQQIELFLEEAYV